MKKAKMINTVFILVFIALFFPGTVTASNKTGKNENAIWIDVRTTDEYNDGHIPSAIHIPHDEITDRITAVTADKQAEIHLYCGSGRRAGIAKKALEEAGYSNVINDGGYKDILEKIKTDAGDKQKP